MLHIIVAPVLYCIHVYRALTLLEPQSRFGDYPIKNSSSLSPKRDYGTKGVNREIDIDPWYLV